MKPSRPVQKNVKKALTAAAAVIILPLFFWRVLLPGLQRDFNPALIRPETMHGRVLVEYWDMWTSFEGEAMQRIVDKFNESQDRIWVRKTVYSSLNERFLVSVSGNMAPDLASIFSVAIPAIAEKRALLRLDDLAEEFGINEEGYHPVYWDICKYRGHLYALPTTPATLALHYNRKLFREAGLDPEKPPRTIAELDDMAQRLTRYDKNGNIEVIGFSPTQPGWWNAMWGIWFGGALWDGNEALTINCEGNIRAFEWAQGYSRRFGTDSLQNFQSGFGNFSSPQNPFTSGLVAMELQGVWMYNLIEKYQPDLDYGVAPFPSAIPGIDDATLVETNILLIPSNARHPREAFEFIAFVQRPENLEQLCLEQRKICPLKNVSREFLDNHPNPYIQVFSDLSASPNAVPYPTLPIWNEMNDSIGSAFTETWLLQKEPRAALDSVQAKINAIWREELEMIHMREERERSMEFKARPDESVTGEKERR
ncbi:MAG TPA: ABC transporter substrate-binding protein [Candidatus Sumerlaeota bacterium]|nr:ABC transporter substrate-binding protein [Candidatus Sumerlaeota bacterium]